MLSLFSLLLLQIDDSLRFFDTKIINVDDFLELFIRFSFNTIVLIFLVRYLYYSITKRKDYLFTYLLIGTIVFLLCFLLENVKLQLGFALGLFAVFGIIRYRTNPIAIKEMTYLFMVIGVSVINALSNKKVSYIELVFANVAVLVITYVLERVVLLKQLAQKTIIYENIDLIKVGRESELKADIEKRTGLIIERVEVGRIDFIRDSARVKVFYYNNNQNDPDDFYDEVGVVDDE